MSDHRSCLDVLDQSFRLLSCEPDPLALDGREVEGLPDRTVPLDEVRSRLLHPSTSLEVRDAVLEVLVAQAQTGAAVWRVGLAGVLLPGLRGMAARAQQGYTGEFADLDAELLAGLLEALDGFDPTAGRIAARLLWSAYRRAARWRDREVAEADRCSARPCPPLPAGLPSHPDLALAKAVAADVCSAAEAELIGATRIGGVFLPELAAEMGVAAHALRVRRWRAELRLVAWLRQRPEVSCDVRDPGGGLLGCGGLGERGGIGGPPDCALPPTPYRGGATSMTGRPSPQDPTPQ